MEEEDIFRWWNLDLAFQQAQKISFQKTENTNQAWKPPEKGTIKLNFDVHPRITLGNLERGAF
jgi:hypothetical protein